METYLTFAKPRGECLNILVTGATGSLGSAVMQRLTAKGHSVKGIGRSQQKIEHLKANGLQVYRCDLLDLEALKSHTNNMDVIVHCAAYAAPFGRKSQFFSTNVRGLEHVFKAVGNSGARVIVVSSASVFDGNNETILHGDETPLKRPKHPYGASKYDAECLAATMPSKAWIGLRPRAVFGIGDQTLLPRLNRLVSKDKYTIVGKGDALMDVTCLNNFLDAVEAALVAEDEVWGKFYNISNGDPRRFEDILKAYSQRHGKGMKRRSVPTFLVAFFAYSSVAIASLIPGKPWEPRLTPYGLRQITQTLRLDISGAQEALQWNPEMTFEQGVEELK